VSPVRYELCFNIPEDGNLHSHRRENLKCYFMKLISPVLTEEGVELKKKKRFQILTSLQGAEMAQSAMRYARSGFYSGHKV
jgi:hypothetical protein